MLKIRRLLIAGILSSSSLMCSSPDRTFTPRSAPEDFAGQGGEAGASSGEAGNDNGEGAGEGGVGNVAGAGAEAGESAQGGASAGEAGARGAEVSAGTAGVVSTSGSAGTISSGGGAAGTTGAGAGSGGTTGASGGSAGTTGSGAGSAGTGSGCPSASSQCVQQAPDGWQGPMLITANAVSSCPSAFPVKSPMFSGLVPGTASCACNCGATQVSCAGTASVTFYQEASCSMSVYGTAATEGTCRQESGSVGISYSGQATATCNAAVVEPSLPVPGWNQSLNACSDAQPQGTCSASNALCVANPSAPFAAKYCVAHAGDQTCPSAYPARSVLYTGYQNTRACPTACSCSASGQECALKVDVHSQADCSDSSTTSQTVLPGGSVCAITSPTSQHAYYATRVVTKAGTCSANSTLTATGSVTEIGLTTLCCTE